jgi:AraC-like DNA-binding protein
VLRAHLTDQPVKPHIPSVLQRLDTFLCHRLHEQITVQMMADQVGFSVPHLSRLCRLHWGQAPHQHLIHLRLQHALLLVQNVELSISQIARYCGFADTQHFVHVFRKHLGSTPTQARLTASGSRAAGQADGHDDVSDPATLSSLAAAGPRRYRHDEQNAWPRPGVQEENVHGAWQIVGATAPGRDR